MSDRAIQIILPIGGSGKRFADHGYTFPKPLVEIDGRPMVELVVENVAPASPHRFIFIVRKDHIQQYAIADLLQLLSPECDIVVMEGETAGALCSVLLAIDHLKPDDELLIVNSDQMVDASIDDFLAEARGSAWDGLIMTFPSTHPKWSFAKEENGEVVAVAEKRPISRNATVGIYYFRSCASFLVAAEKMLMKGNTTQGEYYLCPVYNELILTGARIGLFKISGEQMHSLGTPEDVQIFTQNA